MGAGSACANGSAHLGLAQGFDELLCLPHLTVFEPLWHQTETVRKVLKQFRGRVLLADEVGLGKTIEACMVLKEYALRGMAERTLVLTPAVLVGQWQEELFIPVGERSVSNFMVHRDVPRSPVTGHLVGKGLARDGLGDKAYLVIDGVDARVHYVELNAAQIPDEARTGAILTVGREPLARSVDKTIAAYAARNDGFYEPREHYKIARMTGRIPSGDVEGHVEGHVRRLEALRRAGVAVRLDAAHWVIPKDFLERAAAYDEREDRKLVIEVHSAVALDRQITAEAVTWLDRQLVGRRRVEIALMGFGHQVQQALERRQQLLLANGLAKTRDDGGIQYQSDLLATLQRREVDRVGQQLAAKRTDGMTYAPAGDGSIVLGTYRRAITLTSGKAAVIQRDAQFTLVPWRAILERHRGREVFGIVRGMGVSWQLGMQRDRGLSR